MTDAISGKLRAWVKSAVESTLEDALGQTTTPPAIPDMLSQQILSEINSINTKVGKLMATIADIQSILAAEEATEAKLVSVLQTLAANNASLTQQLASAVAGGDSAAIQSVVDQMKADQKMMETAITAAMPPNATPPGQPQIS